MDYIGFWQLPLLTPYPYVMKNELQCFDTITYAILSPEYACIGVGGLALKWLRYGLDGEKIGVAYLEQEEIFLSKQC
jgi:hypothetical protein